MTKAKKAAERETALDRLAAQLRTALRSQTKNVIEIGNLLIEIRKHVPRGDWKTWPAKKFNMSYRTALNYISAAEYVGIKIAAAEYLEIDSKSATVALSDFDNLSPTVLYGLAEGRYSEQEEAAILAATRDGRVGSTRATAVCDALAPPDDDSGDADDTNNGGEDRHDSGDEEDTESEAILDAPPPAVPLPAPPPPPPDYALQDFDQAVGTLRRLVTKSPVQFDGTTHTVDDLEMVESFIRAVTRAKAAELSCRAEQPE